jgi:hypothetical protein
MRGTDLTAVIAWLEAGCDPAEAAKELRSYQEALSSQSLSLSEAREEIERLRGERDERLDRPKTTAPIDVRDDFEDWAIGQNYNMEINEDEERTSDNNAFYAIDATNSAFIGWKAALEHANPASDFADWRSVLAEIERLKGLVAGISETDTTYVIWSNEHRAWWGPDRRGYCSRLTDAGRYDRESALAVCIGARGGRRFNDNPSEVMVLFEDACLFWPDGGPDDRAWQREAVIKARNLARPFARPLSFGE